MAGLNAIGMMVDDPLLYNVTIQDIGSSVIASYNVIPGGLLSHSTPSGEKCKRFQHCPLLFSVRLRFTLIRAIGDDSCTPLTCELIGVSSSPKCRYINPVNLPLFEFALSDSSSS